MNDIDNRIKIAEQHCKTLREHVGKIDYVIHCYQRDKEQILNQLVNAQENLDLLYYEKQNGEKK